MPVRFAIVLQPFGPLYPIVIYTSIFLVICLYYLLDQQLHVAMPQPTKTITYGLFARMHPQDIGYHHAPREQN